MVRNCLIFALMFVLAACTGEETIDALREVPTLPNADLALLRQLYDGRSFVVAEDMVFEGYVTANDRSGNFFRSFIVDDGTAAVEVRAGFYELHALYPLGRRVVLHARGCAVGMYNGIVQIGPRINSANSSRVDEFGFQWMLDRCLDRDTKFFNVEPVPYGEAVAEGACGRLVNTGKVKRIVESPAVWAGGTDYGSTASTFFRNAGGDTLCVVTSTYASFADTAIPNDSISISGILMYGNFGHGSRYAIKLRDLDDIQY